MRFIIIDDSTIREAWDQQEETMPRKRQWVDEDEEEERKKEEAGSAERDWESVTRITTRRTVTAL